MYHRFVLPVLSLVALLLCSTGCESPGRALAPSAIAQLHDGQTTRAEVDRIFGEPRQSTQGPDGRTLYLYQRFYGPDLDSYRFDAAPRSSETHLMQLSVLFSAGGVVEKHLYSHTQPEFNPLQSRVGTRMTPEALASIVPRKTSRQDLMRLFGPPTEETLTLGGQRLLSWVYLNERWLAGTTDFQVLEVITEDSGLVLTSRITRREAGSH